MKTAEQKCKNSKNLSNKRDELHYQTRNGREKSRKNLIQQSKIKIPLTKLYLLLFVIRRCFKRQQYVNLYTIDITHNAAQKAKLHN